MATGKLPSTVAELTAEAISPLVAEMHPGASVTGCEIKEVFGLGQEVSTAGRAKVRLTYGAGSPALPQDVVVKLVIDEPGVPSMLYRTEVGMYKKFLPGLPIERPFCLGTDFDEGTGTFLLVLEDLSLRGAFFPNVIKPPLTKDQVAGMLDILATLHARFWRSPQLEEEKAWLGSLTEGEAFEFFDSDTVSWIDSFVASNSYRADLIERVGRPPAHLWENVKAVHRYHEGLFPITLLHGDTGAHNSYHLPDGTAGYLDWQLSVRATWPHDVHYCICTSLSVADRRKYEQELVEGYLARLRALGVADVPSIDLAMREFGRALIWGFTIGWMMVPERNYGMEIICANLERLMAACQDHGTFDLADEVTSG